MEISVATLRSQIKRASQIAPRVVIENVAPEIEGGAFPIKRVVGERVVVQADIFADGHDVLGASLLYKAGDAEEFSVADMHLINNDRWEGEFRVTSLGSWMYTLEAWVDSFQTWHRGFVKKLDAEQDVAVDALIGAETIEDAAARAKGGESERLSKWAQRLRTISKGKLKEIETLVTDPDLLAAMSAQTDHEGFTRYGKGLRVTVDREKARFSSWYEMFPRSCTNDPKTPGTFRDCIDRLNYIAGMGFDVLYFPPIHPIGRMARKGKNNSVTATPEDPGSPWAIGSTEGGHKAIHPELGTLQDLKLLMRKAAERNIEIALDMAFQCAPDHPYVKAHREWFRIRPDGAVQYAENPPKKYQDIYPLNFENGDADALCAELTNVVRYWIEQGIRIFRVDNPHTKPFAFWQALIADIKADFPEVIFLSEAFTRPKVMYQLAKAGFTQSYTYFAWKNTKSELIEYFTEVTQPPVREFFRPNLWPNTPDILTEELQTGGRAAFMSRFILASTLGANYGIYGPAFELGESRPVAKGSEEYLNSEKYEVRVWDIDRLDSLRNLIARVNAIRLEHRALQSDWSLKFHDVDNEQLIAYSKMTDDQSDTILVVVNLDPRNVQSGFVEVSLADLRLDEDQFYQVHDLLTDARYVWRGARNFVQLNPAGLPAHIFSVMR
jgi:starch synthase (maltosyl-transferring)